MASHAQQHNGHASKPATEDIPFPTRQLTILAICRFSEPIAFSSILAYTYVMVKDLQGGDDTNASFYAGLLVSAYAVAEAMTAMIWGAISDRYGRKPIVLFGLVGVAISCMIFGLAKTYWVAFLARFVGGALNGNVAVMQTMVAEMVRNPAHEPKAYAVQPFVWSLGSILGSALGGFLAQPATFYPDVFPPDGLFGRYPYLLPNLVAVAVVVVAVVQGIFFLEETNPLFTEEGRAELERERLAALDADETSPLLRITSHRSIQSSIREAVARPSFIEEGLPTTTDQRFDLRRSSFGTMHSIHLPHEHQHHGTAGAGGGLFQDDNHNGNTNIRTNHGRRDDEPPQRTFNFTVIMLTLALVLIAYHQMAFGSILPIHLLDEPSAASGRGHLDLYGGFGFTVHEVGTFMALNGVIALLIQGLVFPAFVERVGVWHSFIWTVALYPLAYIPMPFLTLLLDGTTNDHPGGGDPSPLLAAGIYATLILQSFFGIISGPCILILLKQATPSARVLGRVNGLAMSATCAARTISPPLVGIVYARGGSAAAWASCAVVALGASAQLFWVPRKWVGVGGMGGDDGDKVEVESIFDVESIFRAVDFGGHGGQHHQSHSGVVMEEEAVEEEGEEEEDEWEGEEHGEEERRPLRR